MLPSLSMNYYTIAPPPELAPLVKFFWVLESDQPYTHHSMADGCAELMFHYSGRFDELTAAGIAASFQSGLHAQSQHHRHFTTDNSFGIFAAYLYPYSLPSLFNISADAISNEMPDLGDLLGVAGKQLDDQMMNAASNEHRMEIICRFLSQRLNRSPLKPSSAMAATAIQKILQSHGQINMKQLASDHCLSQRQFERSFKAMSGFSPKLYSRIVRFQTVLREHKHPTSLTSIAYDCGYYDQSHFIHDFKEFSGFHPSHFFTLPGCTTPWTD